MQHTIQELEFSLFFILFFIFEPPHEKTKNLHIENKDADQLHGNREADHAFVFAKRIVVLVHFLFFLNLKFQVSSLLL